MTATTVDQTIQEYAGAAGGNYFEEDPLLRAWLARRLPASDREKAFERLSAFGALCAGRLAQLADASHREDNLPRLERYDRWGKRVDQVRYCAEQLEARRLVVEAGALQPTPFIERMTMAYLLNQNGEAGVTCPLCMTDGLIGLLDSHGTLEQRKRWRPLLLDPNGQTPLTGGQFVTERHGGSSVSENETRATRAADGTWRLWGLKWFCSNPGDLWVTTAKPEGSDVVGLFLVPRRLPNGELNECHLLRLKAITGTRGKATAEVEYRGAYAELIGRPSQGLAILLRTVIKVSRLSVAAAGVGGMRRAFQEARLYASWRKVGGRPVAEFPHAAAELERMEAAWTAAALTFFEELALIEDKDPAAEILIPLLKMKLSQAGVDQVRRAQLLFAGNGIIRDFSILPRLADDALIQEIWEGTHPVLAAHAAKALRRGASRKAFDRLLDAGAKAAEEAKWKDALAELKDCRGRLDQGDDMALCDAAFRALALALFMREAEGPLDIATPFSRLAAAYH